MALTWHVPHKNNSVQHKNHRSTKMLAPTSYVIQRDDFLGAFEHQQIIDQLRAHCTSTMLEMADDPDAPTKYLHTHMRQGLAKKFTNCAVSKCACAPHFTPQHWLLCHMGLYYSVVRVRVCTSHSKLYFFILTPWRGWLRQIIMNNPHVRIISNVRIISAAVRCLCAAFAALRYELS